jgi:hypothetical protein
MRPIGVLALLLIASSAPLAQTISLEYRVKAAYLLNFTRFVEWPAAAQNGPVTICVAGRAVFGEVLDETLRGETVNGRDVVAKVILEPQRGCHVVFVPRGAAAAAYIRAVQGQPVLTVSETPDFIALGGIANFILEGASVRFEINAGAADRAGLRISSRLLRLARGAAAP